MMENVKIFAGSSGRIFAERMCNYMGLPLSSSEVITFSEGNTFVRINESVLRILEMKKAYGLIEQKK